MASFQNRTEDIQISRKVLLFSPGSIAGHLGFDLISEELHIEYTLP
jgi:hypothetical protein